MFRRFDRKVSDDDTVEELVVAATTLSAKKTGAIIVIERSIGLRNYIESGIPLDAKLTYDLLVSIFQPTSPLHDGAVIVQGDRVAAAACFLPLTVNPRLSRELGSRHRAAIGVTEENDAVAIVVSEETGRISLVEDGDIEHDIDAERLRARLRVGGHPAPRPRQAAAGRLFIRLMAYHPFRNLGLKFLSTLHRRPAVAGRRGRARRRARDARAGRVSEPAGRASRSSATRPDTVDVRLRGSSGALSRMAAGDMAAVIDLRRPRPGRRLFHLTPSQVNVPYGVEIVQVGPSTLTMEFEPSGIRTVPVEPNIEGRPGAGLRGHQGDERSGDRRGGGPGVRVEAAAGGDHRAGVGRGSDAAGARSRDHRRADRDVAAAHAADARSSR